jgi:small Trp-rich protein
MIRDGLPMIFVLLGVALLAMKFFELGPVAAWPWWAVLAPFGLAVAWWAVADASGLTQKRAMRRMDERKEARRAKAIADLGLGSGTPGRTRDKQRPPSGGA